MINWKCKILALSIIFIIIRINLYGQSKSYGSIGYLYILNFQSILPELPSGFGPLSFEGGHILDVEVIVPSPSDHIIFFINGQYLNSKSLQAEDGYTTFGYPIRGSIVAHVNSGSNIVGLKFLSGTKGISLETSIGMGFSVLQTQYNLAFDNGATRISEINQSITSGGLAGLIEIGLPIKVGTFYLVPNYQMLFQGNSKHSHLANGVGLKIRLRKN